jgi:anionic cell wall polymer biosynthesis LytR-Cps2A-Psr (LCP) family protein
MAIFDVPGQLGLIIQQINRVDRIDTVYDPAHPKIFEHEIEKLMNININIMMTIKLEDFGKMVDILSGVDIFIPSTVEIYDKPSTILFPSGLCRLDGDKAKLYITYNLPGENAEQSRIRRERFFLGFIKRMGEQIAYLKLPAVAAYCGPLLKTTVGNRTKKKLFEEFAKIDMDRINIQSVGGNVRE